MIEMDKPPFVVWFTAAEEIDPKVARARGEEPKWAM